MKPLSIFFLFLLFNNGATAQNKNRPVFNSYTAGGLIVGQSAKAGVAETVNGIKMGNWFGGLGLSYNGYQYRSVPVYGDIKYSFGKKKQFFIVGDIGYNINIHEKFGEDRFFSSVKYSGGIYLNSGLGYLLRSSKKHSFYFQLDYGKKHVTKVATESIIIDFPPYGGGDSYYTYQYDLKTADFKIGFKF